MPLKDVEVVVVDDRVTFKFKKPSRAQSGNYEVKLTNAKGEESKTLKINMQGIYFNFIYINIIVA